MTGSEFIEPMSVAGVVGRPISHSLSPLLHGRWIARAGLNGAYVPFAAAPEQFRSFLEGLRFGAIEGLNVTLPYKIQALEHADSPTPAALDAGAANLLIFRRDGCLEADNTDGEGMLYAFRRQAPKHDLTSAPVVVLGAGGAARGAAATLRAHGVQHLRIVNRTFSTARDLADRFGGESFSLDAVAKALDGCGTIINTTSAELAGAPVLDLDQVSPPPEAIVMDMLYKPLKTRFLRAAERRGLAIVDGLDMLIGQAIPSFRAFFGVDAPYDPTDRRLLLTALGETS